MYNLRIILFFLYTGVDYFCCPCSLVDGLRFGDGEGIRPMGTRTRCVVLGRAVESRRKECAAQSLARRVGRSRCARADSARTRRRRRRNAQPTESGSPARGGVIFLILFFFFSFSRFIFSLGHRTPARGYNKCTRRRPQITTTRGNTINYYNTYDGLTSSSFPYRSNIDDNIYTRDGEPMSPKYHS